MPGNCPYCGATINFGLRFCVVCGRHVSANNKMGGTAVKSGMRESDMTHRIDEDFMQAQKQSKRRALRFRRSVRTLGQTVFYGFVAGALFFCAVRFALEAAFPGSIQRFVVPLVEPVFRPTDNFQIVKKDDDSSSANKAKPTKHGHGKHSKKPQH
jgi:hypothetical protein